MEWAGAASVLSLSAFLARCESDPVALTPDASASLPDAAVPDAAHLDAAVPDAALGPDGSCPAPGTGFAFSPGTPSGGVFDGWGERTVDPQTLESILASWQLQVDGLVLTPATYSFADLLCLPRQDQVTDFHCVEGWSIHDVPWNGIRLAWLLDRVGVAPGATHVVFHTLGGTYNESLPLDVAREERTLLAYGIDGSTIPLKHGFPLRIVIPRLLGYKSAKYVHRITLTDAPLEGFWVKAGYPYAGEVPADRLRPGKY
jgi:DMSO/TMAO reductase YedYZ molybdopterin-dependent catalytic subunit